MSRRNNIDDEKIAHDNRADTEGWTAPRRQLVANEPEKADAKPSIISKGYEFGKDQFVELGKDELKQLQSKTSTEMTINEFVPFGEIDPVFLESSYYVMPEEAGEKAYALLFHCLKQSGLVALAEVAMHGREHVVAVRPGRTGLVAHTMFYFNEVHSDEEFIADTSLASDKEVKLATQLVSSLSATFDPEKYSDAYRARLQALIDGKLQGRAEEKVVELAPRKQVVDISQALQQSLKMLKKPASRQPGREEKHESKRVRTAKGAGVV